MNICTSFCLLPSSIRRRGRNLWIEGPFGPVEVEALRGSLCHYRGNRLRNGSIGAYLRHIVRELRRLLPSSRGSWSWKNGRSRIRDHDAFFRETFAPWTRERDLLAKWCAEDPDRRDGLPPDR